MAGYEPTIVGQVVAQGPCAAEEFELSVWVNRPRSMPTL